ncbi:uncharacterized protein LOC144772342 isoform X2 [Lissotriton helveticus]
MFSGSIKEEEGAYTIADQTQEEFTNFYTPARQEFSIEMSNSIKEEEGAYPISDQNQEGFKKVYTPDGQEFTIEMISGSIKDEGGAYPMAEQTQEESKNVCTPAVELKTLRAREKQRQTHYAMQGQRPTASLQDLGLSSDEEENVTEGETSNLRIVEIEGEVTKKDKRPQVTQKKLPESRKSDSRASKGISLSKISLTEGRPGDREPLGSLERDTKGGKSSEKTHSSKDKRWRAASNSKWERSRHNTRNSATNTSEKSSLTKQKSTLKRKSALPLNPEKFLVEIERKRRRIEAKMADLTQKKKDFDTSLTKYQNPQKTSLPKDQGEKEVKDIGPLMTTEPRVEEEETYEEDEEQERLGKFQGSEDSEFSEPQWPEEGVDCYPSRPSPADDIRMYNHVIKKAADKYGVQLEEEKSQSCFLLETLVSSQARNTFLPMLPSVLDQGREAFKEPATCRAVTPNVGKKYKYSSKDPAYIKGTVPADSIITSTARKRANIPSTSGPPPEKESMMMDRMARKFERSAANQWQISNSNALLNRHAYQHWEEMEELIKHLPKQYKKKAANLAEAGKNIANTCLKSSLEAADTASRQMMAGITLRRFSWLRISGFKPEVQANIINTPFNGEQLFGSTVDDTLNQLKKDNETAKSMGALQFRGNLRRGATSTRRPTGRGSFHSGTSHQVFQENSQSSAPQQYWQYQQQGRQSF